MKLFPGLKMIDRIAIHEGWPEEEGTILEVDGSNVKLEYPDGVVRWKAAFNLDISPDNPPELLERAKNENS
jgi:hypothetical protein